MVRKSIVAVAVVAAALGGLYLLGLAVGPSKESTASISPTNEASAADGQEKRIASLLGNDPERMNDTQWRQVALDIIRTEKMDNALLVIYSDTSWSGAVQGSDFVQETIDGFGYGTREVVCSPLGIYSVAFQKQSSSGALNLYMAQEGRIIKQGNTGAAFGVVTFAGNCAG